jgi:hypothetical protein
VKVLQLLYFEDDASVGWVDSKSSSSSSSSEDNDDDDNDEWEKRQKRLCLALVAYHILKKKGMKKKRRHSRKRCRNQRSAEMLLQEGIDDGLFQIEYCMSPQSFHKLVGLSRDDLEPKDASKTQKDYLDPETKVMMMLCWLAGGQYVDHKNLPEGYWGGGNNAYCNSEHLLVPYPGQKLSQHMDSFNYFLSQLRIRIENAFALLFS